MENEWTNGLDGEVGFSFFMTRPGRVKLRDNRGYDFGATFNLWIACAALDGINNLMRHKL